MPSKEPRKQLPNGDKVATCFSAVVEGQYPVTVYQHPRTRLFSVEYGHELRTGLRYTEASDELGACLMHAITCSGSVRATKADERAAFAACVQNGAQA